MNQKIRVRFAPSPTGPLHIGGLRTALYNYLYAKKMGGDFILRIEDTDQKRFVKGAEDYIIEALSWCGINPSEGIGTLKGDFGPYKQSERSEIYKEYVAKLIESGFAYLAYDSAEELNEQREKNPNWKYDAQSRMHMKNTLSLSSDQVETLKKEPYVVRIKIPEERTFRFSDTIRGEVSIDSSTMDDKVIFKSDGLPTYHLANVVDDHLMQITDVIRGEEWLSSTPLHVFLYDCFGWTKPRFSHLPLLLKPTGKGKLSKRDGDKMGFPVFPLDWVDPNTADRSMGFKEQGYLPEALVNFLAFLGWNPGTEKELYSLEELCKDFSLQRVGKSGARFDIEKAKWFNGQHIKNIPPKEIVTYIQDKINHSLDQIQLEAIATLMKERVQFLDQIIEKGDFFFSAPEEFDEKTIRKKWKEDSPKIVSDLSAIFKKIEVFKAESLKAEFESYIAKHDIGFSKALIALRILITGKGSGPDLFKCMELIGKQESIERLQTKIPTAIAP